MDYCMSESRDTLSIQRGYFIRSDPMRGYLSSTRYSAFWSIHIRIRIRSILASTSSATLIPQVRFGYFSPDESRWTLGINQSINQWDLGIGMLFLHVWLTCNLRSRRILIGWLFVDRQKLIVIIHSFSFVHSFPNIYLPTYLPTTS